MDENRLKAEMLRRGVTPAARLLAVFDALHESFQQSDFAPFPLFKASPAAGPCGPGIQSFVETLAEEAGIVDAPRFTEIWLMLMNGAVIAAHAGDRGAAGKAARAAEHVLAAWLRGDVD